MSPVRYKPKDYRPAQPSKRSTKALNLITCLGLLGLCLITISWLYTMIPSDSRFADARQSPPSITPSISSILPTPTHSAYVSISRLPSPTTLFASTPTPIPTNPLPIAQPMITPSPNCSSQIDTSQSSSGIISAFYTNWHIILQDGSQSWGNPGYHQLLTLWLQTVNQLDCTPFLASALGGHTLTITANDLGAWWGQYDGQYHQQINLQAQNQSLQAYPSHIQQNIVHELTHVWRDTHYNGAYQDFADNLCGQGNPNPFISAYGATNCSEDFSEAVGYFVIRQAHEWQTTHPYCPSQNPYDWGQTSTYNWIKDTIFNGQQFGPPPPNTPQSCS